MEIFFIELNKSDLYLLGMAGFLVSILIGSILYRKNAFLVKRREQKTELVNNLLSPFNDAIVNIEHGENSYIRIMNALYDRQKVSISRAKATARKRCKTKIETAWNDYEEFYQNLGEERDAFQFMAPQTEFDKNGKVMLRQHMNTIIKSIKSI